MSDSSDPFPTQNPPLTTKRKPPPHPPPPVPHPASPSSPNMTSSSRRPPPPPGYRAPPSRGMAIHRLSRVFEHTAAAQGISPDSPDSLETTINPLDSSASVSPVVTTATPR